MRTPKRLPVGLNIEEFKRLIKATKKEHHKLAFLLGFGAGLRVSEIVGSKKRISRCCEADILKEKTYQQFKTPHGKIEDVDRKRKTILTCTKCNKELELKDTKEHETEWATPPLHPRHIQTDRILIELGKGAKDRVVPIPKGFKQKHLKMLPIGITPRALQKAFKVSCEKAGLLKEKPTLHFHSLRHGFATRMVEAGVPINQVKIALGHSSIATTGVYLRANPKDMLKSYEDLF